MTRLQGKRALITGASRGIGRSIAEAMAREGADIVVNYVARRDAADEVAALVRGYGRRALVLQADVGHRDQVETMVASASIELGPIDILVNNAGIESIVPFLELDDAEWLRVTETNLKGPWLCAQVVARRMIDESRPGAIINIGSVQAGMVLPGRTHYAPTKRGLEALTRNLAVELAPHGIRVNCIHPGVIDTDMTRWVLDDPRILPTVLDRIPLHRPGTPGEIGPVAVFFACDDSSYVTGQSLYVDGGMEVL